MKSTRRRSLIPVVLALAVSLGPGPVTAQYYYPYAAYNPYAAYAQAQYAQQLWNAQMMARAHYAYPGMYYQNYANPGMYAPNYYANPAVATFAPSAAGSYASVSPGDPYASASIGTSAPGYGVSPNSYLPNPYNSYGGGYGYGPGSYFMGVADLNRSYGDQMSTVEKARLLREQYHQARIDTRKKQFELEMYIKANTPTYTEKQAQAAKETLKRIQTNSLPGEIASGRALNYLLDDLDKYKNKKTVSEPLLIPEGMLTRMNVTTRTYGIGLLRDEGRLTWPPALNEILPKKERESLTQRIQTIVKDANKGRLDHNALTDVTREIDRLREDLVKKVNEIPTAPYLAAKRFLQEIDQATIALSRGEAVHQEKFQRFIEGGRTVQDVADYLLHQGLRFGPATASDEAAYRTVYSALATHDIAVNAHLATAGKGD